MSYDLPKSVEIDGEWFAIRYDYRVILEIFDVMNDPALDGDEVAFAMLHMFYMDPETLTNYDEAVKRCLWFINGGEQEEQKRNPPKLVDWDQDFRYIVAPINRVLGYEVRSVEYDPNANSGGLHWWTFLSAYYEIGDCLFAQIVRVREKRAKRKPLDKQEKEFYQKNRDLIDIKTKYSSADDETLKMWTGG